MTYYALVIGVSITDYYPKTPLPVALLVADTMAKFLLGSGHVEGKNIELKKAATQQDVIEAFKRLGPQVTANDTLLIMFAGHGLRSERSTPDGWALSGKGMISDQDLADWLKTLPDKARRIVISDCCYGLGIAKPGQGILSGIRGYGARFKYAIQRRIPGFRIDFQLLATTFAHRLMSQMSSPDLAPMICLAAASATDEVLDTGEFLFAELTIQAASDRRTYDDLARDFCRVDSQTSGFHIETNPQSRAKEIVLSG